MRPREWNISRSLSGSNPPRIDGTREPRCSHAEVWVRFTGCDRPEERNFPCNLDMVDPADKRKQTTIGYDIDWNNIFIFFLIRQSLDIIWYSDVLFFLLSLRKISRRIFTCTEEFDWNKITHEFFITLNSSDRLLQMDCLRVLD